MRAKKMKMYIYQIRGKKTSGPEYAEMEERQLGLLCIYWGQIGHKQINLIKWWDYCGNINYSCGNINLFNLKGINFNSHNK